jgi:hypothetical protein
MTHLPQNNKQPASISDFNIVECAGIGYTFLGKHLKMIAIFALPLFMLKIVTYGITVLLGYDDNVLRQGLFYIPSMFLEAWLLIVLIRFQIFGEMLPLFPWKYRKDQPHYHAIMTGYGAYALIKVITVMVGGVIMQARLQGLESGAIDPAPETTSTPTTLIAFLGAAALLGFTLWAFRLLWVYIPLAFGVSVRGYLQRIGGFASSFVLIGTWMICAIPFVVATSLMLQLLTGVIPVTEGGDNTAFKAVAMTLQSAMEIPILVVANAAIAYGLSKIFLTTDKTA